MEFLRYTHERGERVFASALHPKVCFECPFFFPFFCENMVRAALYPPESRDSFFLQAARRYGDWLCP
jgi:hypothetical protein